MPPGSKSHFKSWRDTHYYFVTNWKQISDDGFILRVLSEGYKIEFLKKPPSFLGIFRHTEISKDPEKRNIILEEVKPLLEKNAIEIVDPQNSNVGFYLTIFIVPKQSGGFQAILNLRKLNKFIKNQHFKMKTLRSVIQSLNAGDWAFSKDLSDAYMQVLIHSGSRKFLRFAIEGTVYQYRGLPFGISVAPRLFTKK